MGYVAVACRVVIALVFTAAVVSKVRNRAAFAQFSDSLTDLPWLTRRRRGAAKMGAASMGAPGVWAVAVGVVVAEIAVVVLVAVPAVAAYGLLLAAAVLVAFTAAVAVAVRAGARIVCRCFGADGTAWGAPQFVRNGLLVGVALVGGYGDLVAESTELAPPGLLAAVSIAAVVAFLLIRWDDLSFLLGGERVEERR